MESSPEAGRRVGELAGKALKGVGVATAVAVSSRLLMLIQQLILARLLDAEDFGQFAFTLLVIGLPALLANLRGAEAIVQSDREGAEARALVDTAFTSQLIVALAMMAAVVAGNQLLAGLLHKPYLGPLLMATSVLILSAVGGLSSNAGPLLLPAAMLERRLDFVRARLPEFINVFMSAVISIALALAGFGVWSLVAGIIAGSLVQVILLWRLAAFRPALRMDRDALREYLRFGWPLYLSYLLSWGYLNADYYFVGRWLGEVDLGLYYMAFNISQILLQVRFVLSRVAFPTFSRAKHDLATLSRLYVLATRYTMMVAACASAVGIGLARPALALVLGEQWLPAAPALQVLLLSALVRAGLGFNGDLLMSLGKTSVVLVCTGAAFATLLALGPWMMVRWGIVGMAGAVCCSSVASAAISSAVICRHLSVNYLRELGPALFCLGLVAGCGLWLAGRVQNVYQLIGAMLVLALSYLAIYAGVFDRARAKAAIQWLNRLV